MVDEDKTSVPCFELPIVRSILPFHIANQPLPINHHLLIYIMYSFVTQPLYVVFFSLYCQGRDRVSFSTPRWLMGRCYRRIFW